MIDADEASRLEAVSTRLRRKGDALRQRGDAEKAREAYEGSLGAIDQALAALGEDVGGLTDTPVDRQADTETVEMIADLTGRRGGLLRRLERLDEALRSYTRGAELERSFSLAAHYNRMNALKLSLLVGARTLGDVQPELHSLRADFEQRLRSDEQAADDAWMWADLADCLLLLGEVDEAEHAYRLFAQKAETQSPATTLQVIDELATTLRDRGDALGPRLVHWVNQVRAALAPVQA